MGVLSDYIKVYIYVVCCHYYITDTASSPYMFKFFYFTDHLYFVLKMWVYTIELNDGTYAELHLHIREVITAIVQVVS